MTAAVVDNSLANGRLTLTSGTPVTTSDVTAATTLYYTPYNGNRISLYDGTSTWTTLTFNELSLALTNYTANSNYDIWAYNNSGTVALESTIWTNDTTRTTALVYQNGVLVKSGATTRRYLGTIRITGTTGQTEDSASKRFVWNINNRVKKQLVARNSGSWTWNQNAWRAEAGNTTDGIGRFSLVYGYPIEIFAAVFLGEIDSDAYGYPVGIGIGIDSTTANSAQINNGPMVI